MMTGWCHSLGQLGDGGGHVDDRVAALLGFGLDGALTVDLAACNAWNGGVERQHGCSARRWSVRRRRRDDASAQGGRAGAIMPQAKSVTLPGCGHMMMSERPDAVLDALIAHFGAA